MLENVTRTRFRGYKIECFEDLVHRTFSGRSQNNEINKILCNENGKTYKLKDVLSMPFDTVGELISTGLYSCEHKKQRPLFCNRTRDRGNCFIYQYTKDVCPYLSDCSKYAGEEG